MLLWTIQDLAAWERFQQRGVLRADARRVCRTFRPAYEWMAQQMRIRLGEASTRRASPIWAWYQWKGEREPRPDLRASGHLARGTRGVRIEFETNEPVLLSDFELWHNVLNDWYLPNSEADGERFQARLKRRHLSFYETKPLPDPRFHRAIVKSWERIFDLDWNDKHLTQPKARKSIQATLWQVEWNWVRAVSEFVAR